MEQPFISFLNVHKVENREPNIKNKIVLKMKRG